VRLREQKTWLRVGRLKSIETLRERWGAKEGLASARKRSLYTTRVASDER
jgi:hypothetical protein